MRDAFIAFCRSKGDETYDFHDIRNCALAQSGRLDAEVSKLAAQDEANR